MEGRRIIGGPSFLVTTYACQGVGELPPKKVGHFLGDTSRVSQYVSAYQNYMMPSRYDVINQKLPRHPISRANMLAEGILQRGKFAPSNVN